MAIIQTIVVLKVPHAIAAIIVLSKAVLVAMTNNKSTFVSPTPAMPVFSADIDALDTAQTATKARTKGAVEVRNEKRKVVEADLRQLRVYVQGLANASPEHAEAIAAAAGMTVHKPATRNKSDLVAKAHTVSGSVKLVAKATKGSRSYEWQYSLDGKTWTTSTPSAQATTVIVGLQANVLTYFRHRAVTRVGPSEWSQPVSTLVA